MLSHPLAVRSARHAALSGLNKLRKNFFRPVSFETIFAFGRAAVRYLPGQPLLSPKSVLCYALSMTAKKLKDALQRVEAWPEAAQVELAELALEIDAESGIGIYKPTPAELKGIDRGLKAARDGRIATGDRVEELFKKHRPA
jgi:hypothetical protein